MEIIRKTNVLIKTARRIVIRRDSSDGKIGCGQCGESMVTAHYYAVFHGISQRVVYRLIEAGKIHFVETATRIVYVCPNCGDGLTESPTVIGNK